MPGWMQGESAAKDKNHFLWHMLHELIPQPMLHLADFLERIDG
ncbi:hypothetical protein MU1_47490 [Paenibacillus glycanilyticus]|uniref:Uncharacterized protein n=1 Tax=Paenibacillus glycanilyticus TaxID=126569 RepID=A0ABQ6GJM3_9BACL|nr:hypothetical protein MU1_47490 [Paenibacillus glycanilyticus]